MGWWRREGRGGLDIGNVRIGNVHEQALRDGGGGCKDANTVKSAPSYHPVCR